jgi:hypothetical protein
MLKVVYEAVTGLAPGELVEIRESRGRVDIKIKDTSPASEFIPELNAKLAEFVGHCSWFQIWRGQVISASHPESPLTVQYEADPEVELRSCVQIREDRGVVRLHVCPTAPAPLLIRVLNPAIESFLSGKQWFQLWHGEIVTMDDRGSAAA